MFWGHSNVYALISFEFLEQKVLPSSNKLYLLSFAVHGSNSLDVNLKLFDTLGRLAMGGMWTFFLLLSVKGKSDEENTIRVELQKYIDAIKNLIENNPILYSPIQDNQVIDISLAVLLLMLDQSNNQYIGHWLTEMVNRIEVTFVTSGPYPCIYNDYVKLLEHPKSNDKAYFEDATAGSILYPMISFWASILKDNHLYSFIQRIKKEYLEHCNFQFLFFDETSEENLYCNKNMHGATLSDVLIENSMPELLMQISRESEQSKVFNEISANKRNLFPLVLVACRHYRLPIPLEMWQSFYSLDK